MSEETVGTPTYRIKNWERFQHYQHRRPVWIKLYVELLNDPEWMMLKPVQAQVLVNCWLVASMQEGCLPSIEKLSFILRMSKQELCRILDSLSHWILKENNVEYQDASKMLANGYREASEMLLQRERQIQRQIQRQNRSSSCAQSDEEFFAQLKSNPAYAHIDIERELAKMDAWLSTHPGRRKTKRFIVNWLNKIDPPVEIKKDWKSYIQESESA